jgi:hypothetical protein
MSSLSDMGSLSLTKGGPATQGGKEVVKWNACWLCRRSNEGGKHNLVEDHRGGIGKANREEHRR